MSPIGNCSLSFRGGTNCGENNALLRGLLFCPRTPRSITPRSRPGVFRVFPGSLPPGNTRAAVGTAEINELRRVVGELATPTSTFPPGSYSRSSLSFTLCSDRHARAPLPYRVASVCAPRLTSGCSTERSKSGSLRSRISSRAAGAFGLALRGNSAPDNPALRV